MSLPTTITAAFLDKILAFLAPLFLGTAADLTAAREAAGALLVSYGAQTNRELRLAALTIAFSVGALDALSRAASADLTLNQVMRLRGNANALNRAALQNENRLDKLQRQALVAAEAVPEPPRDLPDDDLPASLEITDLMTFARAAAQPAFAAAPEPVPQAAPVSRQQRRLLERQAEKARRRQQEQARLTQRAAQRMARRNATAMRTAQV